MKEIGTKANIMGAVLTLLMTEISIRETSSVVNSKVLVSSIGLMALSIEDNGSMLVKMEEVNLLE